MANVKPKIAAQTKRKLSSSRIKVIVLKKNRSRSVIMDVDQLDSAGEHALSQ